jgi:RNA recognition motif-containing protein
MDDCVIMRDKRTQKPRGFGFITYQDIESVVQVIQMHNEHFIDGKWIDCKSAIPFEEIKSLEKKEKEMKMGLEASEMLEEQ